MCGAWEGEEGEVAGGGEEGPDVVGGGRRTGAPGLRLGRRESDAAEQE